MTDSPDSQPLATSPQPSVDNNQQIKTGGLAKEKEIPGGEEYLEEAARIPELEPEVEKAGVEHVREEIEIPEGVPPGITPAGPATPVATQPTGLVKLPLTEEEMTKALHLRIMESIRWLAEWCLRQIKIAHQKVLSAGRRGRTYGRP